MAAGGPKADTAAPRLKLVIRRLPPTIPEEIFWKSVSEWITPESCTWKRWVQGAKVDENNQHQVFSRAYVLMSSQEKLVAFAQAFDGHGFRSKDGLEYRAVVEFAPSQKVPNQKKIKVDSKQGQIDSDPAFASFMEILNAPLTKPEAPSLTPYVAPSSTALLDHLRDLRSAKGKSTHGNSFNNNSPSTPHRGGNSSRPDDSPGRTPKTAKQAQAQRERDRAMADGASRAIAQAQAQVMGSGGGQERGGRGGPSQHQGQGQRGASGRNSPSQGAPPGRGPGQGTKGKGKQGPGSAGTSQNISTVPPPTNKPVIQIMKRAPAQIATNNPEQPAPTPLPARDTRSPVCIPSGAQSKQARSQVSSASQPTAQRGNAPLQARPSQRPKIATGGLGGKALLSAALNASTTQSGASPSYAQSAGSGSGRSGGPSAAPVAKQGPGAAEEMDADGGRKRVRTRGKKKVAPGGPNAESQ